MKNIIVLLLLSYSLEAQNIPFASFKSYPFPTGLCAASTGDKIAWALDEQGARNVYVAEGPEWSATKLTSFSNDDGQEITSISISGDGHWVVFVRGGEHNASWGNSDAVNPGSALDPVNVRIASVAFAGGEIKYLSAGDKPFISPDSKKVGFLKDGELWSVPIDGSASPKKLFTVNGSVREPEWNNTGTSILFTADRGDHSLIGIYSDSSASVKWIDPSFTIDNSAHWSADEKRIVFIRRPCSAGSPATILTETRVPWSIYVADVATAKASILWQSGATLSGTLPTTSGGTNLHWAAGNTIVFLSYADGWPHLYSIAASGGKATLLTPGNFSCEHIRLSPDKKYLSFSVNIGHDRSAGERRHVAIVRLDTAYMQLLSDGDGLEWMPVLTGSGKSLAFISATFSRPPLTAVIDVNSDDVRELPKIKLIGQGLIPKDFPIEKFVVPVAVSFKSMDGLTVHADLFMPPGEASKKPAIVYAHGGPSSQMLLGWHYSDYYANAYACNQYLASQGFVVLAVNFRLSTGYGFNFQQAEHAAWKGSSEYQDIKAAGLWLRKQSFVDGKKIGIYGSSFGGYLTALALARDSKIFSAGVDMHGINDWLTGSSILGNATNIYEKAPDYDKALKIAWASSPISSISTWTSPVLIIHGDDDRNVDFTQSTDLINRLAKKGVPYETLMMPGETHHWMKWNNTVAVYTAVADFFERKLKNGKY